MMSSPQPDGVEALEHLLKAEPVDAMVLDLSMPRMGGIELLQRLRGMAAFCAAARHRALQPLRKPRAHRRY